MRICLVFVCCLHMATPALATETATMICKNGIVSKGDFTGDVISKCGEPTGKTQREEKRFEKTKERGGVKEKTVVTTVTIDDWTYNFGPNEFMHRVLLENGRVTLIESLGYGY